MPEPLFSEAWCQAAVRAFNEDPDAKGALTGWEGDVALVVEEVEPVALCLRAPAGEALATPERTTLDALEALAPRYWALASRATWHELIQGTLDPIAAIVQKRLRVKGDVQQIVLRLKYRGLAERWLARIRGGV